MAANSITKARPEESRFYYHFIKCGFSTTSTAQVFIPLAASDTLVESTILSGSAESVVMICPFDGSLETVWVRSTGVPASTVIGFHLSTTTNEVPSATATQTVTVDMSVDDTSYEFDFASAGINTFSQGDTIMFSIDPTSRMYDIHFMIVLKFDTST